MNDENVVQCSQVMFFFFSSRRRHTRLQGDWSSDVCSSDLASGRQVPLNQLEGEFQGYSSAEASVAYAESLAAVEYIRATYRSEERRVGKECRSRWSPYH